MGARPPFERVDAAFFFVAVAARPPFAFFAVVRFGVAAGLVAGFLARSLVVALSVPRGGFGI